MRGHVGDSACCRWYSFVNDVATGAYGYGEGDDAAPSQPPQGRPSGGSSGNMLTAEAGATSIKVTQVSGGTSGSSPKALAPVDPNWEPPPCWYEPVATPQQLKAGVDELKKGGDLVRVTPSLSWGEDLMVSHYEKGETQTDGEGYKDTTSAKTADSGAGDHRTGRTTSTLRLRAQPVLAERQYSPRRQARAHTRCAGRVRRRQDQGPGNRGRAEAGGQVHGERSDLGVAGRRTSRRSRFALSWPPPVYGRRHGEASRPPPGAGHRGRPGLPGLWRLRNQ